MKRSILLIAAVASVVVLGAQRRGPSSEGNPFAGNAAAIEEGRSLYNNGCTACHGLNGNPGVTAPGLSVSGHAYGRNSDAEIFDAIKNGISDTAMPPHGGKLNDDQIWKITAYVHGLRGTAIDAPSPGNVAQGEQVFFGKGQCATCHMMHGKGSVVGPDLSNIAGLRKTNSIIDALTREQHKVFGSGGAQPHALPLMDMYPAVQVTTADGKVIRGVLRNEDNYSLQLMGLDEHLYLLDRAQVKSVVREPKSLMPTDYDKRLSKQEFDDLVAFLTRQGTSRLAAGRPRVQD